jgi:hypothetical protein
MSEDPCEVVCAALSSFSVGYQDREALWRKNLYFLSPMMMVFMRGAFVFWRMRFVTWGML